jgi:hypothetical protein
MMNMLKTRNMSTSMMTIVIVAQVIVKTFPALPVLLETVDLYNVLIILMQARAPSGVAVAVAVTSNPLNRGVTRKLSCPSNQAPLLRVGGADLPQTYTS